MRIFNKLSLRILVTFFIHLRYFKSRSLHHYLATSHFLMNSSPQVPYLLSGIIPAIQIRELLKHTEECLPGPGIKLSP